MTHRSTASIWATVLAALVALLAALGLGGKAAPAAVGEAVAAPVAPAARRRPAVVARRTWRAVMRGGSLPPTIKQRIRAEAHGKAPSVRRSTTAAALAPDALLAPAVALGPDTAPACRADRDRLDLAA
ncbi:DUF6344 domain-containing protein [Streptomyces sp. WAC07149]|uniref:DUF6344 domain-containing protein n=1 Tax=Streptomyces sp. WAC07149 TaxID=2487425 RepID=UPI0026C6B048|nr:DUF6344 domain-containing protein [Streptomyces sp. WAC07149]